MEMKLHLSPSINYCMIWMASYWTRNCLELECQNFGSMSCLILRIDFNSSTIVDSFAISTGKVKNLILFAVISNDINLRILKFIGNHANVNVLQIRGERNSISVTTAQIHHHLNRKHSSRMSGTIFRRLILLITK